MMPIWGVSHGQNSKIFFDYDEWVDNIKAIWDVSQRQIPKFSSTMVKEWMVKLGQFQTFHKVDF